MPLTHFDAEGKARMVDVTEKKETVREATATGKIKVSRDVYDAIEAGTVRSEEHTSDLQSRE